MASPSAGSRSAPAAGIKRAVFFLLPAVVLLTASGRLDWIAGWVYLLLVIGFPLAIHRVLSRISPDLLDERSRMHKGTKSWDKVIAPLIAIVLPIATWILAGLDARYGWTPPLPPAIHAAGFVTMALGAALAFRAMIENRFFASTVRIQTDRGHAVISTGPYAWVRHPGYTGVLLFTIGTPALLGSEWAAVPSAITFVVLIVRTMLEDRTLQAELDGYREYASRVRWKLVPGLW
jgi:protein-S-isoprenylcysteine O-methyltransferase Ste14